MNVHIPLFNLMTTDLVTVSPNTTMDKVGEIFKENTFHHLPVVDSNNKIVGIISKSDYLVLCDSMTLFRKEIEETHNKRLLGTLLAEEVMTKQLAKLKGSDPLSMAVGFFKENLFHAIPIISDDERLLGLITTFDLINYAFRNEGSMMTGEAG